jgi:TonB family protein
MNYPSVSIAERKKDVELVVVFWLDRDGKLSNAQITKPTGSAIFDQASLDWLAKMQPFPAIPADLEAPKKFTVPIRFVRPTGGWNYDHDETRIKQMMGNICKGC